MKFSDLQNLKRNIGPLGLFLVRSREERTSFRLSPNRPLSEKSRSNLKQRKIGWLFQSWGQGVVARRLVLCPAFSLRTLDMPGTLNSAKVFCHLSPAKSPERIEHLHRPLVFSHAECIRGTAPSSSPMQNA